MRKAQTILLATATGGCIVTLRGIPAMRTEYRMRDQAASDAVDARRGALMAAAQAGDRAAYAALLRDCVPLIRAVAARRAPADRIDDIIQETLLTVHRARQTYDPTRSFNTWLSVIADRRAIDIMRRALRENSREVHAPLAYDNHPDDAADPSVEENREDAAFQVNRAVATLPARQREAVQYLVLEEQTLSATAQQTGRSEGALKVNLHRALKALRARFDTSERP